MRAIRLAMTSEAADLPGADPEPGVISAVQPAADLVRADLRLGQLELFLTSAAPL